MNSPHAKELGLDSLSLSDPKTHTQPTGDYESSDIHGEGYLSTS